MKKILIFIFIGLAAIAGGVGVHYATSRVDSVRVVVDLPKEAVQASVAEVFTPPLNVVHCGESAMLKNGKLTDQKAYDCFEQYLRSCSPADFVAITENGNIKYLRTIIESRSGTCLVREAYLAIAKADLIGKSMTCAYNPTLPFTQVINYRNCVGTLRDELFNRLSP